MRRRKYHDRQAIVLRGEDLQDRMSKAEQEAVKIQSSQRGKTHFLQKRPAGTI